MAGNEAVLLSENGLFKKIVRFSVPVVLSGLVQLLFNAADVAVVGQFCGRTSVSAVSSNGALITLIVNLFLSLNVGVNVLVSNFYGAQDRDGVSKAAHTSMAVSVIAGICIGAFGYFFSGNFLALMNVPPDVLPKALTYVKIYFLGVPFLLIYNFGATIITASGDTVRPMKYIIISGAVNVVLNIVFVKVFSMDVAGVATATVVSMVTSSVMTTVRLIKTDEWYKLDLKKIRIRSSDLMKIVRIGLPAGFQSTMFSISNVIIQSSINSFGDACMSGSGSASTLEGFVYVIMSALAQASLNFVSYAVGAHKHELIGKITRKCMAIAVTASLVSGVMITLLSKPFLSIYLPGDTEAIAYGTLRLWCICAPYFICAIPEVLVGSIRGMGVSLVPMIVSLVGICVFRIVWIETVFAAFHDNITVLFISYPITWTITAAAHFVTYLVVKKRLAERYSILGRNR